MTVGELISKLGKYPKNFKVVLDTSCDYEDYDEAYSLRPVEYGRFRSGHIDLESDNPNAVFIN